MESGAFSQLLTLYTWFLLAAFIAFLLLIARFYGRFAGERTYYLLFLVPIILFGVEAVRQTRLRVVDDAVGALLAAVAGLVLIGLSALLVYRMTTGRTPREF
ncbi:MAG: hypothetical protein SGJ24_16270 [Chloroflexota bacterium]|nr:hypothetical protein [Chloroflexota bacterium]